MREYAKVLPQFWIGPLHQQLKRLGVATQVLALYLSTNPQAHMLGVYYLPLPLIVHETGMTVRQAKRALANLCALRFCEYDPTYEYIWVRDMAFEQIGRHLKPTDNQVKSINDAYLALPALTFLADYYQHYEEAFHLRKHPAVTEMAQLKAIHPSAEVRESLTDMAGHACPLKEQAGIETIPEAINMATPVATTPLSETPRSSTAQQVTYIASSQATVTSSVVLQPRALAKLTPLEGAFKPLPSPLKGALKPLPSQEQKKEQKKEQEKEREKRIIIANKLLRAHATTTLAPPATFLLPLVDKTDYAITEQQIIQWQRQYPAIDVKATLFRLQRYYLTHKTGEKTRSEVDTFITHWLNKATHKASLVNPITPPDTS